MPNLDNPFFNHFDISEKEQLYALMIHRSMPQGSLLLKKGEQPDRLFISTQGHTLSSEHPNDILGVIEFFDQTTPSQNTALYEDSAFYELTYKSIEQLDKDHPTLYKKLLLALGRYTTTRLKDTHTALKAEIKIKNIMQQKREFFSNLLLNLLVFISGLLFLFQYMRNYYQSHGWIQETIASSTMMLILISFLTFVKNRPPLSAFGLTWKEGKASLGKAIPLSLALMCLLISGKYIYIQALDPQLPLFALSYKTAAIQITLYSSLIYAVFCFPQELIARGMLQGPFSMLLSGKYRVWLSILVSNIIYGAFHAISLSSYTAIIVTITGIPWGWLYSRHKTLVGPVFSHIVVGLFAFYILGPIP